MPTPLSTQTPILPGQRPPHGRDRRHLAQRERQRERHRSLLLITIALLLLTMVFCTVVLTLFTESRSAASSQTITASSSPGRAGSAGNAPAATGEVPAGTPTGEEGANPAPPGHQDPTGLSGADGSPGPAGRDGSAGARGPAGATGTQGTPGKAGPAGPVGPAGPAATTANGSTILGTGVTAIGTCDTSVTISLGSTYTYATNAFTLSSVTLGDIDGSCSGRSLSLMLYDSAGTVLAQTSNSYRLNGSGASPFTATIPASALSSTVDATSVARLVMQVS